MAIGLLVSGYSRNFEVKNSGGSFLFTSIVTSNQVTHFKFEKLILKLIHYLESTNQLDLTGKHKHGFKINKSTATAGALLQSVISRAADEKCYVVMASLDLSMAFNMVNTINYLHFD